MRKKTKRKTTAKKKMTMTKTTMVIRNERALFFSEEYCRDPSAIKRGIKGVSSMQVHLDGVGG
jgi:hypothetical protein